MSWRPEVKVGNWWEHNSIVFATEGEAMASAKRLFERWTMAEDYRACEVDDPINYQIVDGEMIAVPEGKNDER